MRTSSRIRTVTVTATAVTAAVVALVTHAAAGQQAPPAAPPIPAAAQKHIDAARATAGEEWQSVVSTVCDSAVALARPPRGRAAGAAPAGGGGPRTPPARETWAAEPHKVFDNLYYVGERDYSAWAITTSQGIIVLDAIFDYSVKDQVEGGLRKLGLNPADIKYVVVSHGHVDHAAGAKYLQDTFGARVVMGAADYDLLDRGNPPWKPKRDLVATDGMRLTLGDFTMTLYLTPGHTEGTISAIFPVRDGNRQHTVATWGGTSFNFGPLRPRLLSYAEQAARYRGLVEKANADVILSNHPGMDGTHPRIAALGKRTAGQPHPFVVGNAVVQRYLRAVEQCAHAALEIVPS
jgi:metallo-beta-lactamase class B